MENTRYKADIACISLGYDNATIIQLLGKRGKAIYDGRLDSLGPTEKKIAETIQFDMNEISRPVVAFITFSTVFDKEQCLEAFSEKTWWDRMQSKKHEPFKMLDQEVCVMQAKEPHDLIWENFSIEVYISNRIIYLVKFCMLLFIVVAGYLLHNLIRYGVTSLEMLPRDLNCEAIEAYFQDP